MLAACYGALHNMDCLFMTKRMGKWQNRLIWNILDAIIRKIYNYGVSERAVILCERYKPLVFQFI